MIILFDMDGTLTPARQVMSMEMAHAIGKLSKKHEVGIVTGSGLNYVLEQCSILKEVFDIDWEKIHLLPCNGTQWYKFKNHKLVCHHSADMKSELGKKLYQRIVSKLCYEQSIVAATFESLDFFGTFVQYRKSLLNWCPIGRDSDTDTKAREKFVEFDKLTNFRKSKLAELNEFINTGSDKQVTIVLGGHTSFDIYPIGWDKTYALNHFDVTKTGKIVFVGDRCTGDGNDRTIYQACYPDAYQTTSPENTLKIIKRFLDE